MRRGVQSRPAPIVRLAWQWRGKSDSNEEQSGNFLADSAIDKRRSPCPAFGRWRIGFQQSRSGTASVYAGRSQLLTARGNEGAGWEKVPMLAMEMSPQALGAEVDQRTERHERLPVSDAIENLRCWRMWPDSPLLGRVSKESWRSESKLIFRFDR